MTDFFTFYQTATKMNRIYFNESDEYTTQTEVPKNKCGFSLTKGYEANDADLKRYAKDLYVASQQIKKSKAFKGFDYTSPYQCDDGSMFYRNHSSNVQSVFKLKCKGKYEKHEPIDITEHKYMESTFNAGLMYSEQGINDCHGFDFSSFYGSILASKDFKIPNGKGEERTISKFPSPMKTGFYRVKIECDDVRVRKVFSFSPDNVYTSDMVTFAFKIQEKFNMTIELIQDGEPNAYIYLLKTITNGSKIFDEWYKTLSDLKKELPKNMIIKILSSSLWGRLSKENIILRKESETDDINFGLLDDGETDFKILDYIKPQQGEPYYSLVNIKKPYTYNLRLKPWITSYGRIKTASIILDHLDDVVRVHTDGIVFKTKKEFDIEGFLPEAKYTRKLEFKNLNDCHYIAE